MGWTPDLVLEYLKLLERLTEIVLEDNKDIANVGLKNVLSNIVEDFHQTVKMF